MLPKNAKYYFCKPSVPRGLDVNELYTSATAIGLQGNKYNNISEAITSAKKAASKTDLIIITGSIFLVADALNAFNTDRN